MNPFSMLAELEQRKNSGEKMLAVLLDPDKASIQEGIDLALTAEEAGADWLMVGGSLTRDLSIQELIPAIKKASRLPILIFPGSPSQIVREADAIMFLSLISGRNADLLIGRHVEAAPLLKHSSLEVIPTGYMLIESGKLTTVNYVTHTFPIPHDKADIAMATALAGEMLGLRMIYMDGGSGAHYAISPEMIQAVSRELSIPLIVGGGIRTPEHARKAWAAGADMIVVGTAFEKDPDSRLIYEMCTWKNQIPS